VTLSHIINLLQTTSLSFLKGGQGVGGVGGVWGREFGGGKKCALTILQGHLGLN